MIKTELKKGVAVEMEHAKSLKPFLKTGLNFKLVAEAIAKDHLKEHPGYYKLLSKLENKKGGLKDNGFDFVIQKALAPYYENGKTVFNLRHKSGCYLIYKNNKLVYVGLGRKDVYKSLYHHLQQWNDRTGQYRKTYKNLSGITVSVIYTDTPELAVKIEQSLILKHRPKDNKNKYDGYILDQQEKKLLKRIKAAPKDAFYQYEGDLPF